MKLTMVASMSMAGVVAAWCFVAACADHTSANGVAQGGLAGAGGRNSYQAADDAGQASDAGGSSGSDDASLDQDAGACNLGTAGAVLESQCGTKLCCNMVCSVRTANTADMVDCAIPMEDAPSYEDSTQVYVFANCVWLTKASRFDQDAGTPTDPDSWSSDPFASTPQLVFGASLCESISVQGNVPIYVMYGCPMVCIE